MGKTIFEGQLPMLWAPC